MAKLYAAVARALRLRISGWMRVPNFSMPDTNSSKVSIAPSTPGTLASSSSMRATETYEPTKMP